jgi:hypothetical protein
MTLPPVKTITKLQPPTLQDFLSLIKTRNLARTERFFVQFAPPASLQQYSVKFRDMMLLCEEAAIPGKTIETRTLRINGLNEQRAHTADYMGDSITLQFYVDTDWTPREIMEKWMELCVNPARMGREVGWYDDYIGTMTLHALVPAGIPGEKLLNWSPTQADFGLNAAVRDVQSKNNLAGVALSKALTAGKQKVDDLMNKAKTQVTAFARPVLNPLMELLRETETISYSVKFMECWPRAINVMPVGYGNMQVHKLSVTFTYKYWESSVNDDQSWDEKLVNNINDSISKQAKKLTDSLPKEKLSSFGADLKSKAMGLGKQFGG